MRSTVMENQKKPYNLEKRTLEFAKAIIRLCKKLPQNTINFKITGQLIDSSGSVGANYREANEALSKKDFTYRMRISRKECKETTYWSRLLKEANPDFSREIEGHIKESQELRNIFSSIIEKKQ
jgi:four helix bundle protein